MLLFEHPIVVPGALADCESTSGQTLVRNRLARSWAEVSWRRVASQMAFRKFEPGNPVNFPHLARVGPLYDNAVYRSWGDSVCPNHVKRIAIFQSRTDQIIAIAGSD